MPSLSSYLELLAQQKSLNHTIANLDKHPFYRQAADVHELLARRKAVAVLPKDKELEYAFFVGPRMGPLPEGVPYESLWASEFPEFVRCVPVGDYAYRIVFKW